MTGCRTFLWSLPISLTFNYGQQSRNKLMPLSSQEDHARQSEIHKNKNGAYINMHSLSLPPPPTHHQPGDWIILSALPKSFKGYQQTVILTLHKAI